METFLLMGPEVILPHQKQKLQTQDSYTSAGKQTLQSVEVKDSVYHTASAKA
jgi:hypothetical protein